MTETAIPDLGLNSDPWAAPEIATHYPTICDVEGCPNESRSDCPQHSLQGPPETPVVETPEEVAKEEATNQTDDTDPDLEGWNTPAPEVVAIQKSRDELVLERLLDNIFDPETATKHTKALFYGDMGTGKTIAACAAEGRVLLVAIENGAKSLRNHPKIMARTKIMKVLSVNQIERLAEQLQKGALPEYETIVLDTFSELQKKDLDNMVDAGYAEDNSKNRWTPEGKQYQGNTEHMRRIAAAFRDVDRNVIFVTHEKEDKDEMQRINVRPDLTAKVAATLGSYVDVVARFTSEIDAEGKQKFFAQFRPTRGVTAKTRIGNLPAVMENTTFRKIHDADISVTGQEGQDNDNSNN